MLNPKALSIILSCICILILIANADAQDATTQLADQLAAAPAPAKRAQPQLINPATDHDQLVNDLQSGDDTRVTSALAGIRAYIQKHGTSLPETRALRILLDAKRYSDLDAMALAQILKGPGYTLGTAAMEKLRAQSFLAAGNGAAALSAAKAYYNVARLKDTADAIDTISLCLAAAHPDDPEIVQRFKEQQVAWATAAPSTQPDQTPADATLGDPILAGIQLDSKPFDAAIAGIDLDEYAQFVSKGNLLLLAGRAAEAHEVFNKAVPIAPAAKAGEAAESVARAIRAEAGCVAPANAYILSLQVAK